MSRVAKLPPKELLMLPIMEEMALTEPVVPLTKLAKNPMEKKPLTDAFNTELQYP